MKFANVFFKNDSTIRFEFARNDDGLRFAEVSLDKYPTLRDAYYLDRNNYRITRNGDTVFWPSLGFDLDAEIVAKACL